jgi:hypothetical protein
LAGANWWPDHLPWVVLVLRVALLEDSGVSAAELVYGPLFSSWPVIDRCQASTDHFSSAAVVSPSLCSGKTGESQALPLVPSRRPLCLLGCHQCCHAFRWPTAALITCACVLEFGGRFQAVSANNIKPQLGTTVLLAVAILLYGPACRIILCSMAQRLGRVLWRPSMRPTSAEKSATVCRNL